MHQPELGKRLTALRKQKNLTQEELVEKSHVSVRTIQRIEAGEVLPRLSTVKILLEALGENYESFSMEQSQRRVQPRTNRNALMVGALAGIVYLVSEIILGAMDVAWFMKDRDWDFKMNALFSGLTIVMIIAYALFARGFIVLTDIFENKLLKFVANINIVIISAVGIFDIATLSVEHFEILVIPYAAIAVLVGALSIAFGTALIRLQDGMGELSRIAGFLEIVMGCLLVTVVLFFFAFVMLIPTLVVEILLLYRGYEYLSRLEAAGNS